MIIGLLTKTEIAVQSNKDSQEEEKIKLAVMECFTSETGNINYIELKKILPELKQTQSDKIYIYNGTINKYIITNDGIVTKLAEDEVTAATIIPKDAIGIPVEYNVTAGNNTTDWLFFNTDGVNIYLISKYNTGNTRDLTGTMNFSDISSNNGKYSTGSNLYINANENRYGKLATVANKWLSLYTNEVKKGTEGYINTNGNNKMTSYMLDTTEWTSKYTINSVDNGINYQDKVEYVIGGPTIEMVYDSYNRKHELNENNKKVATFNNKGYWAGFWSEESPYTIEKQGYWIASPSSYNINSNLNVHKDTSNNMFVAYSYSSSNRTISNFFRPVICLKANVILKTNYNQDGTISSYGIK